MVEDLASIKKSRLGQEPTDIFVSGELIYDGDTPFLTSSVDPSISARILDSTIQGALEKDAPHRVGGHPLVSGPAVVYGKAVRHDGQVSFVAIVTMMVQLDDRAYVLGDIRGVSDRGWELNKVYNVSDIGVLPVGAEAYFCGVLVVSRAGACLYNVYEDIFTAGDVRYSPVDSRVTVQGSELFYWSLSSVPVDSVSSTEITFTRNCILRATVAADDASKSSSLAKISWVAVRRGSCWVVGDPREL